jgi:asparagine synthase (glutamine-hydrolysing)
MGDTIRHRGPDDGGVWYDTDAGIGLSHRRLSIIDLSPAGHQPMESPSGRYVIAFNGEIYNHAAIRRELETTDANRNWRGHSDTETLLAGFDAWGIETTVKKSVGMFAFAVWDKQNHTLCLGRDRLGEKPLYYGWQGDAFLFGSELKALKAHPDFRAGIDRQALMLMMRHNYVPAPFSIYQGIEKLEPGSLLTVSLAKRDQRPCHYWDARQIMANGPADSFKGSADDAVAGLDAVLKQAVSGQMIADVPLGAFLSGGVDSTAIVAVMQSLADRPVRTFTIGFNESGYNEAQHAKQVAAHLGTDHTELYVTPQQALDVIPSLPGLYCEPFSDSSQIPTFLLSKMARQHVTVALSGDGGDELFCGYDRYLLTSKLSKNLQPIPLGLRKFGAGLMTGISPAAWNKILSPLRPLLKHKLATANLGDKLHKGAAVMTASTPLRFYQLLNSHWTQDSGLILDAPEQAITRADSPPNLDNFFHLMMAIDTLGYLPDDILVKVDRAAMGVSLETRVPLLDHRVLEFAWRLPIDYKIRHGEGKWLFKQLLYKYVPKNLMERPKMGFGAPIDTWLRGPLREWAEHLLDESKMRRDGYLNPQPVRQKWAEHLSGQKNWQYHLWDVLMFQAWLEAGQA